MKRININIDDTLYNKIQLATFIQKTTITKAVTELLKQYVDKPDLRNKIAAMSQIIENKTVDARKPQKKNSDKSRAEKEKSDPAEDTKNLLDWYKDNKDNQYAEVSNGKLYVKCSEYKKQTGHTLNGRSHNSCPLYKPSSHQFSSDKNKSDCYVAEYPQNGENSPTE